MFKAQDPGIQEDENVGEQDLPKLLKELQELQNIFDLAAVKKYRLHKELEGCKQRLEAASTIISRFVLSPVVSLSFRRKAVHTL